jgi:hypothetical protein
MGKKTQELSNGIISIAKTMPLIIGGLGGLVLGAGPDRNSPLHSLLVDHNAQWTVNDLAATYLFCDAGKDGAFKLNLGFGAKLMAAGVIVHKLLTWIDG